MSINSTPVSISHTSTAVPSRRSGRDWVSKTDLIRYLECPYAFAQLDRGIITPADLVGAVGEQLIDAGIDFHENIVAAAVPLPENVDLAEALASEETVLSLPTMRNPNLKILGAPDGVEAAGGTLIPIEMKSHRDVRRTDLLELAFYWLLLEPYRTTSDIEPCGIMMLRRDGRPENVRVDLGPEIFAQVRKLIGEVRKARRSSVQPRVCGCPACRGPLSQSVARLTRDGKDLSLIWGIGRRYAQVLECAGVNDYEALIGADPRSIVGTLRREGLFVSADQVTQWQAHARAYREAQAVIFGPPLDIGDSFIALDLEYDPMDFHIWLIGMLICDGDRREHVVFWADDPREERNNLCALSALVDHNPALPVLTYAGVMADLPQLQSAEQRHELQGTLQPVVDRHHDLFTQMVRSLRLPAPLMSLGDVGSYFGVARDSTIRDGFEAQSLYGTYLRSRNTEKKEALREALTNYNRGDLDMLADAYHAIRDLHAQAYDSRLLYGDKLARDETYR